MTDGRLPFRVLFVCVGNTCRSPMAEQLLRARLENEQWAEVDSAGILAEVGSPMTTEASDALIAHVGTIAQHRAKQLTEAMVAAADLVLAATRDIRADIVRSVPNAVRRTFTVREFARLAALMPDDAVPALSGLAAAVAAERVGAPDADDDVADPIGKPARDYVLAADVLNDAVTVIARALQKAWSATSLRDSD